jgi:hypothetical protein
MQPSYPTQPPQSLTVCMGPTTGVGPQPFHSASFLADPTSIESPNVLKASYMCLSTRILLSQFDQRQTAQAPILQQLSVLKQQFLNVSSVVSVQSTVTC